MQDYALTISENRKINIKPNTAATKPAASKPPSRDDGTTTATHSSSSSSSSMASKDKRTTTTSRRQQRHSTEIGSEYYRWWAVRSSLGFQTNEHIAGLLLDGFHALLQHIVSSCGGEEYPGRSDMGNGGKDGKGKHDSSSCKPSSSSSSSSSSSTAMPSSSSSIPSSSSSSSSSSIPQMTKNFTSSLNSPPGAEEMEGFSDFNHAIAYYTNTLWWMCAQPDSGLHKMRNASPVLQEFILRLIGYLRGGRSFSLNDRKRTFPKDTSSCPISLSTTTTHVNSSFSFPVMTFTPLSSTDITKSPFISISHSGQQQQQQQHGTNNAQTYPSYITPSLTPLMLSSKVSTIVPNSSSGPKHHHNHHYHHSNHNNHNDHHHSTNPNNIGLNKRPAVADFSTSQNTFRIVGGKIQGGENGGTSAIGSKMTYSNSSTTTDHQQPSLTLTTKEKQSEFRSSFRGEDDHPPSNFLTNGGGSPSNLESDTNNKLCGYRPKHDLVNAEYQKWPVTKEYSTSNATVQKYLQPSTSSISSGCGVTRGGLNVFAPELKHMTTAKADSMPSWSDKNTNVIHVNETKPSFHFNTPTAAASAAAVKETLPRSHKGIDKDGRDPRHFHHAFTQATPLLFFPAQQIHGAAEMSLSTGCGGMTNVTHKFVANSPMEGFYGQYLSNSSGMTSSQRSQCLTYPSGEGMPHSINQPPKQRPLISSQSSLPLSYTSPLLTSRSPSSINPTSMIPLFYSPAATATPKIQTTTNSTASVNSPWASGLPSYSMITSKTSGAVALNPFICNQNNTMRDNFNLFRMYQDISKPSYQYTDTASTHLPDECSISSKKSSCSKSDFQIASNSTYSPPLDNQEKHHHTDPIDVKDSEMIFKGHFYNTSSHNGNRPFYLPKQVSKPDYNKDSDRNYVNSLSDQTRIYYDKDLASSQCDRSVNNPRGNLVEKREDQKYPRIDSDTNTVFTFKDSSSPMENMRCSKMFPSSPQTVKSTPAFLRRNTIVENETKKSPSSTETEAIAEAEEGQQQQQQQPMNGFPAMAAITSMVTSSSSSRLAKAFKPRRFVCTTCTKVFYSGTDLVVHRYEQHSHVCSECDGRFLSLARLQQHKVNDHPQMLVCSHCKFTTFNKDNMDDHRRSHRSDSESKQHTADPRDEEAKCGTETDHTRSVNKTKHDNGNFSSESEATSNSSPARTTPPRSWSSIGKTEIDYVRHREPNAAQDSDRQQRQQPQSNNDGRKLSSDTHAPPDQHVSAVREDGDVWRQRGLNLKPITTRQPPSSSSMVSSCDTPCPGSVFPSFSKSTAFNNTMTSSKVDNMVNLFSQVKDYCRFDPTKFLPYSFKEESNEADSKESILVIDTSSSSNSDAPSKDQQQSSESRQHQGVISYVNQDSQTDMGKCFRVDGGCDDDVEMVPKIKKENTPSSHLFPHDSNSHSSHCRPVVVSSGDYGGGVSGGTDFNDGESYGTNSRRKPFPVRSRKKRRKGQSVKYSSSKRFKHDDDVEAMSCDVANADQGHNDSSLTKMYQSKQESSPSEFRINEECAQNSVIKPHTVWLDDCPSTEGLRQQRDVGVGERMCDNRPETWTTLQSIDENSRDYSHWKSQSKTNRRHHSESHLELERDMGDTPSPHKLSGLETMTTTTGDEADNLNNRILSLRERHRSHSLPPKKRGIRKSYRINGDNNNNNNNNNVKMINDSENSSLIIPLMMTLPNLD